MPRIPRWLKVSGSVTGAVLGFLWLALDFVGTAATVMDLFEWVPLWVRKLAAHDELVYQIGPWILIGLSLVSLLVLHFWPEQALATPSQPGSAPLNVAEWLDHPNYFVWAASCLWINQKPLATIDEHHPAYPTLQMIKGYLEAQTIKSIDGGKIAKSRVSREELVKLAQLRGERPKFLFPDAPREELRKVHKEKPGIFPDDLTPLSDAARMLYEVARERGRLLATAAEQMSGNKDGHIVAGTAEEILDYMATYIGGKEVQLFGTRPPSEKLEIIPINESKRGTFESGALVLKGWNVYTDLSISKRDLYRIISALEKSEI